MISSTQYIGNPAQASRVFRALYDQAKILLENGKKLTLELSEHKHKRTNEQNAYYWVFNNEVADFLNGAGLGYGEFNIPYTKDIIHGINKTLSGIESTREMKVGEFCQYIDRLLIFWQERTGGEFMMSELPANYLERKGYIIK